MSEMVEVQRGYGEGMYSSHSKQFGIGLRSRTRCASFTGAKQSGVSGAATVSDHLDPIGGLHEACVDKVAHAI